MFKRILSFVVGSLLLATPVLANDLTDPFRPDDISTNLQGYWSMGDKVLEEQLLKSVNAAEIYSNITAPFYGAGFGVVNNGMAPIKSVTFNLRQIGSTCTGVVDANIYGFSALNDNPDSSGATLLGTSSTTITVSAVSSSQTDYTFTFTTAVDVSGYSYIGVVIEDTNTGTGDGSNHLNMYGSGTSATRSDVWQIRKSNLSAYTTSGDDPYFIINADASVLLTDDSSVNGNDLTNNNTVESRVPDYWRTGEPSGDFEYTNSEYLSITDASQTGLDFTGSWSSSFWIKAESFPSALVPIGKSDGTNGYMVWFYSSYVRVYNETSSAEVSYTFNTGKWYHVATVHNATDDLVSVYVNGNLAGTAAQTTDATDTSIEFNVGAYNSGATRQVDGLLKDVAVWNTELTPLQIKSLALGIDLSEYTYRPDDVSTAPDAYYKLNEISGNRSDSSGNGHTLTDNNTVLSSGGYIEGVGADFVAASSEYLSISDTADFDLTGTYSVSFWSELDSSQGYICSKWNGSSGYAIRHRYSDLGTFDVFHNGTKVLDHITGLADKGQFHYAVVYNTTANTVKLYIDGELADTHSSVTTDPTDVSTDFEVGRYSTDYFDGTINDLAIWNGYELTASEVASLAAGLPIQQSGVVSYWDLDETSGTRADSIGSNTLADNNTVLYGTGKVGNAADFESTNSEYLSITDASLDITSDFSLISWIKPESHSGPGMIMDKDDSDDGYGAILTDASQIRLYVAGSQQETTATIGDGVWGHIVGVWDGINKIVYIDGVNEASGTTSTAPSNTGDAFHIGSRIAPSNYFDGLIDESVVAERYFRPEEIKATYLKGLNAKEFTSTEDEPAAPSARRIIVIT